MYALLTMPTGSQAELDACEHIAKALIAGDQWTALGTTPRGSAWQKVVHSIATDPTGPGYEMLDDFDRMDKRATPPGEVEWSNFWCSYDEIRQHQIERELLAMGLRMEASLSALDGAGHAVMRLSSNEMLDDDEIASNPKLLALSEEWFLLQGTKGEEIDEQQRPTITRSHV